MSPEDYKRDTELQPHLLAFNWYKDDLPNLVKTRVTSILVNKKEGKFKKNFKLLCLCN
jgi:hypothetical protein